MSFKPIPGFERYLVGKNGTVLDNESESILMTRGEANIDSKVKLLYKNRTDRYRTISVARLILLTHSPISGVDLSGVWSPKFKDPSSDEFSVTNLDYDFGDYIPPKPIDRFEFHPVPGYVGTQINLAGEVIIDQVEGVVGSQREYAAASARLPSGETVTVGRHRLMALTFLQHPLNCDDLIVNHKNGIPGDDEIENLEWTSYRGNILHAHATGLNTNNIPIEVKDLRTGNVEEMFSIGVFCRTHELNQRETKRLEFRMRTLKVIANYRDYAIRRKDEGTPWDDLITLDKYKGNAKEVVAKNTTTDEVSEFIFFNEAAEFLGLSQYALRGRLRKYGVITVGDYTVSYGTPHIRAGTHS